MPNQKLIQFLLASNLMSSETATEVASLFTQKDISKNNFLLKEGRVSNEYFYLENGFMRAFAHDTEGNDVTTNFYSGNGVAA